MIEFDKLDNFFKDKIDLENRNRDKKNSNKKNDKKEGKNLDLSSDFNSNMNINNKDKNQKKELEIYYDFHMHTKASDGFLNIKFFKEFLKDKNHLISITDHNEIRKSIKIYEEDDINSIPGIEIGCDDGMEILAYFNNPEELEEFYRRDLEPYRNRLRMAKTHKSWEHYIEVLKEFDTHLSLPHLNGYAQKNYLKNKKYLEKLIKEIDSIETYNHALDKNRNLKAREIRKKYDLTATFGSDAHTKMDIKSYANLAKKEVEGEIKILEGTKKIISLVGLGGKHLKYIFKK